MDQPIFHELRYVRCAKCGRPVYDNEPLRNSMCRQCDKHVGGLQAFQAIISIAIGLFFLSLISQCRF